MRGEVELRFTAFIEVDEIDQEAIDQEIVNLIGKIKFVASVKEDSFCVETTVFPDVESGELKEADGQV